MVDAKKGQCSPPRHWLAGKASVVVSGPLLTTSNAAKSRINEAAEILSL